MRQTRGSQQAAQVLGGRDRARAHGPALERLARGERPIPEGVSYDDVDGWNARCGAAKKNDAAADMLLELDRGR